MNENNIYENQPIPETDTPNVAEPAQPVQPVQPVQPEQPVYTAPVDVDPPAQPVQPTYTQPAQPAQPVYAQPAQPVYAQPNGYTTAAPVKEEGKGLAIGSLVCSILSFFCCGILSIVGIILGAVAKKKGYKGGMATAGIVVGAIYTGILVITATVMAICDLLGFDARAFMSKSIADSYYNDSYDYGYYDSYDNYDDYFDYDFDY